MCLITSISQIIHKNIIFNTFSWNNFDLHNMPSLIFQSIVKIRYPILRMTVFFTVSCTRALTSLCPSFASIVSEILCSNDSNRVNCNHFFIKTNTEHALTIIYIVFLFVSHRFWLDDINTFKFILSFNAKVIVPE